MKTSAEIKYAYLLGGFAVIPEGTSVIQADNLPQPNGKWWAEPWIGMSEEEDRWQRNYGFLLDDDQVEDSTLSVGKTFDEFFGERNAIEGEVVRVSPNKPRRMK